MGAYNPAENTPNALINFRPKCLPKPKSSRFLKKKTLCLCLFFDRVGLLGISNGDTSNYIDFNPQEKLNTKATKWILSLQVLGYSNVQWIWRYYQSHGTYSTWLTYWRNNWFSSSFSSSSERVNMDTKGQVGCGVSFGGTYKISLIL